MTARRVPLVTLILIGANIVAAFALFVYPDFAAELGFRADHPRFVAAVTCLFLHANLFHLLGNMVFLAAVGVAVELSTGSLRFATVYFLSGLAGVGVHFLANQHNPDTLPLIGASGCIAGCAAYYSFRYTKLKVPLAPHFALSVAAVTGIWLVLQIVGALVRFGDGRVGVSFWSHLGGFGAGALLAALFRSPDLGQLKLGHEVLEQMNARGPAAVVIAARRHLETHPRDIKVLWDLADALQQQGEGEAEADTLLRLLDITPEDDQPEVLRRICQNGRVSRIPVIRRLQFSDRVCEANPAIARALLMSVVDGEDTDTQRPDAMLALVGLERRENPERASGLLAELLEKFPLHPATELARKRGWTD